MSEYEHVARSKLKLKVDDGIKKKKKEPNKVAECKMTPAEQAFLKQQEKLQKKRILEKASMTHKQRVEEFNRKLDNLTEHFDIPKVSWTK